MAKPACPKIKFPVSHESMGVKGTSGLFSSSLVPLNPKVNGVDYTDLDKDLDKYFIQSGGAFPKLWT